MEMCFSELVKHAQSVNPDYSGCVLAKTGKVGDRVEFVVGTVVSDKELLSFTDGVSDDTEFVLTHILCLGDYPNKIDVAKKRTVLTAGQVRTNPSIDQLGGKIQVPVLIELNRCAGNEIEL